MQTETIEHEPQIRQPRSFDIQASVDMLRFDLERKGFIHPETMQRVFDEELTYLAEGIDKPLRTEFTLKAEGEELLYFDRGEWRPYISTLLMGLEVAKNEAKIDPRKQFQESRATRDLEVGFSLKKLRQGESMTWLSSFPEQECQVYGEKFIGEECGYQPKRRMGFLYIARRNEDNSVTLTSQSVDNSDDDAFAAALQETDMDSMTCMYDTIMEEKYGGKYSAGRRVGESPEENAWEVIKKHEDLLEYFFEELVSLAESSENDVERAKKRLTYGVWAAIKKRIDRTTLSPNRKSPIISQSREVISHEIALAYQWAVKRGEVIFGCGGSIKGEDPLLDASTSDVFDMIFETKIDEDKYGPLTFKCPKGHNNKRPPAKSPKDFLKHCKTCGTSLRCN